MRNPLCYFNSLPVWRWHLNEVFVKIDGEMHYLRRAVDHEGEVLEVFATKRRDRKAALAFLQPAMKRDGRHLKRCVTPPTGPRNVCGLGGKAWRYAETMATRESPQER